MQQRAAAGSSDEQHYPLAWGSAYTGVWTNAFCGHCFFSHRHSSCTRCCGLFSPSFCYVSRLGWSSHGYAYPDFSPRGHPVRFPAASSQPIAAQLVWKLASCALSDAVSVLYSSPKGYSEPSDQHRRRPLALNDRRSQRGWIRTLETHGQVVCVCFQHWLTTTDSIRRTRIYAVQGQASLAHISSSVGCSVSQPRRRVKTHSFRIPPAFIELVASDEAIRNDSIDIDCLPLSLY